MSTNLAKQKSNALGGATKIQLVAGVGFEESD